MKLPEVRLGQMEFVLLVLGYELGTSVILSPAHQAQQMSWLAIIVGLLEAMLIVLCFTTLAKRFSGQTMIEICETVYGPIVGTMVAGIFIWYLFNLGSIVLRNSTDFLSTAIMPETPGSVIGVMMLLVATCAVFYGIEVISRCSVVLVPLTIGLFIIIYSLQLSTFNFQNLFPLFDLPLDQFLWASHSAAIFPFGESAVFLMIFPFVNSRKYTKLTILGLGSVSLIFILAAVRSVTVLGATAGIFTYPAFEAVKMLNLPYVNTRLEVVVAINFLTMSFLKLTVLYYGIVLSLSQLFRMRTARPLVIPIGIMLLTTSILDFRNIAENFEFVEFTYPVYASLFQLVIPGITLLMAVLRGKRGETAQ